MTALPLVVAIMIMVVFEGLEWPEPLVPLDDRLDLLVRVLDVRYIQDAVDPERISVGALFALQTDAIVLVPQIIDKHPVLLMLRIHLLNIVNAEATLLKDLSLLIKEHPDKVGPRPTKFHMGLQVGLSELTHEIVLGILIGVTLKHPIEHLPLLLGLLLLDFILVFLVVDLFIDASVI